MFPPVLSTFLMEKGFNEGELLTIAKSYSNHQPTRNDVKLVLDKIAKLDDNGRVGMVNVTKHLRSKL